MKQKTFTILIWLTVALLLYFTLRNIAFIDLWHALTSLNLTQLLVLLGINALVIVLFGARWWAILRALDYPAPFTMIVLHRLAGFGVSYFTPGPQVGGEAVMIKLVHTRHHVPFADVLASVGLDKLVEITTNLLFILIGLTITLTTQFTPENVLPGLLLTAVLLMLPLLLIGLLWRGIAPLTWLMARAPLRQRYPHQYAKTFETIRDSEARTIDLLQRRPLHFLLALGLAFLSWGVVIVAHWLLIVFLGVRLPFSEVITLLVAQQISFLLPLPGGIGALEASQVFVFEALGHNLALGLSVSLIMRGRDVLFGLIGLWWAGSVWKKPDAERMA